MSSTQPHFSQGADTGATRTKLTTLTASPGGRWALTSSGKGIERTFKFKTFAKTWDFMTAVSLQCKINNHHPEWSNVFNTTFIRWTTHAPEGLSDKDVDMAIMCDSIARDFGEAESSGTTDDLKNLADRTSETAGACCVPKTKTAGS